MTTLTMKVNGDKVSVNGVVDGPLYVPEQYAPSTDHVFTGVDLNTKSTRVIVVDTAGKIQTVDGKTASFAMSWTLPEESA